MSGRSLLIGHLVPLAHRSPKQPPVPPSRFRVAWASYPLSGCTARKSLKRSVAVVGVSSPTVESNETLPYYASNKSWIDAWLPEILRFPPSLQKLEWNHKGGVRDIWKYVIQFRASGVRVKRPSSSPSLVAMTTTQVPIIAWEKRYMTPRECASVQCLGELKHLPEASTKSFKALGNAVNATVVQLIAQALFSTPECANKLAKTTVRRSPQLPIRSTSRRSA